MHLHCSQCAQSCARRYVLIGEPDGGICGHAWRTWGLPAAGSPSSSTSSPAASCKKEEEEEEEVGGGDEACSRPQGLALAAQRMRREHGCKGGDAHEATCPGPGAACGAQRMQRMRVDRRDPHAMQCGSGGRARAGPGAPCGVRRRASSKRARGEEEPAHSQEICRGARRERSAAAPLAPYTGGCSAAVPAAPYTGECGAVVPVAPYAADGFERVDLPGLSRWQVCRTDERWLERGHSACVAFRRRRSGREISGRLAVI